jgi:CheY-like chemotaxis protein
MDTRSVLRYHDPMADTDPRVVVLTDDLFFQARIDTVARAVGVPVAFVREVGETPSDEVSGADCVVVDLNHPRIDPPAIIRTLKSTPGEPTVIAFGPHRDREGLRRAHDAGADRVMARSKFTELLPELLRGPPG